ncbi:MAG: hypothetical protein AB1416_13440 [Actinomycetota bacterium]
MTARETRPAVPTTAEVHADGPADRAQGNGQAIAVALATGFASFILGLMTILAEASASVRGDLQLDDAVGPLSGKATWATVAFAVSWAALAAALRGRELRWRIPLVAAGVLLLAGFLLTFPPIFQSVG